MKSLTYLQNLLSLPSRDSTSLVYERERMGGSQAPP